MADAKPSRPGVSSAANTTKVTLPVAKNEEVGRNKRGRYVKRTTMTNGDIREDFLFEGDAADNAPLLDAPKPKTDTVATPGPEPVKADAKPKAPKATKKGS